MNSTGKNKNSQIFRKIITGIAFTLLIGYILFSSSCISDYFPPPPTPPIPYEPVQTENLEVAFASSPPTAYNSSFWNQIDYIKVAAIAISVGNTYGDGLLNATGTFNGTDGFNGGDTTFITMKAAYDDQKVYILIEWNDDDFDVSRSSWLYNGPPDAKKSDDTLGWTSQRNSDKVSLAFEIDNASSEAGSFSSVGCRAACHNNEMKPSAGNVDLWNWDLATSEPLGYANDMYSDASSGLSYDAGQRIAERNNAGVTDRSGPAYEFDGNSQTITKPNGGIAILDPGFFMVNKTPFIGDAVAGDIVYINQCQSCHGVNGKGNEGPPFNNPGLINRLSRSAFKSAVGDPGHEGYLYYIGLSETQKDNLISRIYGFGGVPGYFLTAPSGSSADIWSSTNALLTSVEEHSEHSKYQVMLIRNLETGNTDDVQFTNPSGKSFVFGIALMDKDGINHIGSANHTMTFKSK